MFYSFTTYLNNGKRSTSSSSSSNSGGGAIDEDDAIHPITGNLITAAPPHLIVSSIEELNLNSSQEAAAAERSHAKNSKPPAAQASAAAEATYHHHHLDYIGKEIARWKLWCLVIVELITFVTVIVLAVLVFIDVTLSPIDAQMESRTSAAPFLVYLNLLALFFGCGVFHLWFDWFFIRSQCTIVSDGMTTARSNALSFFIVSLGFFIFTAIECPERIFPFTCLVVIQKLCMMVLVFLLRISAAVGRC